MLVRPASLGPMQRAYARQRVPASKTTSTALCIDDSRIGARMRCARAAATHSNQFVCICVFVTVSSSSLLSRACRQDSSLTIVVCSRARRKSDERVCLYLARGACAHVWRAMFANVVVHILSYFFREVNNSVHCEAQATAAASTTSVQSHS